MATISYNNNNNWVVPGHTGTVQIEVWGAGGGGGANNRTGNNGAGGGGGGAYARSNLSQLSGANLTILIGAGGANGNNNNTGGTGGTSGFNNNQVSAVGGAGGTLAGVGGANGLASGGTGQTGFNGGNGAGKVATGIAGGGGSSAGNAAVGRVGQAEVGGGNGSDSGNLPAGAGAGGNGGGSNANGSNGVFPGGGAGGAGNNVATTTKHGGTGAIGEITLTWTIGPVWMEAGSASTQDFSLFDVNGTGGVSGTVTSSTQSVLGSARSIACFTGASSDYAFVEQGPTHQVIQDTGTRISFGFRFNGSLAGVAGVGSGFCDIQQNGANDIYTFTLNSTGKIVISGNSTTYGTGTTTLTQNTDYRISIAYTITSTTVNTCQVYINGVLELSVTNVTLIGTGSATLYLNAGYLNSVANLTNYFAHIYVDSGTSGDVGNVRVTAKRPSANGTTNNFTGSGTPNPSFGTGNARYVNYRPLQTATADVAVSVAGTARTEEYDIEAESSGDNDVTGSTFLGYMGWIYAKSSTSEVGSLLVNNIEAPIPLTSTTAIFWGANGDATYPAGSGTDIGLVTTTATSTVTMYDAGMLIAYIPVSLPTGVAGWLSSGISSPILYDTAIGV